MAAGGGGGVGFSWQFCAGYMLLRRIIKRRDDMQSSSPCWVNRDSARNVIHMETCDHAKIWAYEPKWKKYPTLARARADYPNAHECEDCIP